MYNHSFQQHEYNKQRIIKWTAQHSGFLLFVLQMPSVPVQTFAMLQTYVILSSVRALEMAAHQPKFAVWGSNSRQAMFACYLKHRTY